MPHTIYNVMDPLGMLLPMGLPKPIDNGLDFYPSKINWVNYGII